MKNLNSEHQVKDDDTVDMVREYILSVWSIPVIVGLAAMLVLYNILGIKQDISMMTGLLVMPILALIIRIFEPKNTEAEIGKENTEMLHFVLYATSASLAIGIISEMLSFKFPIMEQASQLLVLWTYSICCVIYMYRKSHKIDLVPLIMPALVTCIQIVPEIIK